MKLRKRIKRTLIFGIVSVVLWVFNAVPRSLAVYLGGWIGVAVWKLSGKERYKAERHLTLVYGDELTHRQKLEISRDFYINMGKNLADIFRFRKSYHSEIKPLIHTEGMDHLRAAFEGGRGVIGVTGHIGNFELLAAYLNDAGFEVGVIGRELYDKRLDKILVANRESVGLRNFSTTESPRHILAWLKSGKGLGVLIDTDSHRVRGEFIPAFGRWSYTPIGQTVLGLKTGCAFLPMACLREKNGTYRILIKPAINVEPSGHFETDVYNVTLACTRELEKIIRAHPDQWIWQHNRWRTSRESHKPVTSA